MPIKSNSILKKRERKTNNHTRTVWARARVKNKNKEKKKKFYVEKKMQQICTKYQLIYSIYNFI